MSSPAADITTHRIRLRQKRMRLGLLLLAFLLVTAVIRITQGEWSIPLSHVFEILFSYASSPDLNSPEAIVVRSVRLPRFFAAVGAGGMLAMAGVVLQGLLSNPLAEPYTLGIAAGAAFGGALGFFFNSAMVTPFAFIGALGALWMVSAIAWRGDGGSGTYLVLAGIITNAVLSAGVTFLKAIADDRLAAIVLWLMGSLSGASARTSVTVWVGALALLIPALIYGRELDAVSLGEEQGERLGVNEKKLRIILLSFASFGTALTVSSFGIIGFVGLVIPHLIRAAIGPSHRALIIFSFLAGGTLLAIADGVAQAMGELPVGVLTAIIGGPFFCWILAGRKGGSR